MTTSLSVFAKSWAFYHAGPVGVHHHKKGFLVRDFQCLLIADKFIIAGRFRGMIHFRQGFVVGINDHIDRPIPVLCDSADAQGGAKGIHIRLFVAHDDDLGRLVDELSQGVGHDPRFSLVPLFHSLKPAAVIFYFAYFLHNGLVASTPLGQIQRSGSVFVPLLGRFSADADADAQGNGKVGVRFYFPHFVQNGEFIRFQLFKMLMLENDEVLIVSESGDGSRHFGSPLPDSLSISAATMVFLSSGEHAMSSS
jgi:hypothetical protein